MPKYIHGKTRQSEINRLEYMAEFCAPDILDGITLKSGSTVLDVGCGVGAMTFQISKRFSDVHVFAFDLQMKALITAKVNHPIASYMQANAINLPFADNTFDFVHGSWILEHVPSPIHALKEIYRILKPGGQCRIIEVDNTTLKVIPLYPEIVAVISTLNKKQLAEDLGDPFIGQKLEQLFSDTSFSQIQVWSNHYNGTQHNPHVFDGLTHIFGDIYESIKDLLGIDMEPQVTSATIKIRQLRTVENSEIHYSPVIAHGIK